jgi:hypothetical protein
LEQSVNPDLSGNQKRLINHESTPVKRKKRFNWAGEKTPVKRKKRFNRAGKNTKKNNINFVLTRRTRRAHAAQALALRERWRCGSACAARFRFRVFVMKKIFFIKRKEIIIKTLNDHTPLAVYNN